MTRPKSFDCLRWRAARRIAEKYQDRCSAPEIELPFRGWHLITQILAKLEAAEKRGWRVAAAALRNQLQNQIRWLSTDLHALAAVLMTVPAVPPTARDLYHELLALEDEFDAVELSQAETELRVTTESIVLEGVYLGPFRLIWNWSDAREACRVVAIDPCHPECRDDVTHPHVLNDALCEGDATGPLRRALQAGRLCDYFLIVRQVLRTYNASSAYVELEHWDGESCEGCRYTTSRDNLSGCEECDSLYCDECSQCCWECSRNGCRNCLHLCPECDQYFCRNCWPAATDRSAPSLCRDCHKKSLPEEIPDEAPPVSTSPSPRPRTRRRASPRPAV